MKSQTLFTISFLFILSNVFAEPIEPKSEISSVTVYTKGAQISHTVLTTGILGLQTLIIKDLPLDIDPKSIVVEAENGIDIISINTSLQYKLIKDSDSETFKKYAQNIVNYRDSIAHINCFIAALNSENNLIEDHDDFTNDDGDTDINEVIKASEFYRKRIKEIELELLKYRKRVAHFNHEINLINTELSKLDSKYLEQENVINLKVDFKRSFSNGIKIKYYTPKASWYTYYDLKVEKLEEGINLMRKAFVSQNTGKDWDNVKLTLSNASPLESSQTPSLTPYNILGNRYKPIPDNQNSGAYYGRVIDEDGVPLIGVNVLEKGTTNGTITDLDGNFKLKWKAKNLAVISYTGYHSKQVYLKNTYNNIVLKTNNQVLDEVVITGYKESLKANSAGVSIRNRKERPAPIRKPIQQAKIESINSVEYNIEMPFSLKSNGKEIDVLLEQEKIATDFEYFSAPIKSEKAYLIAKVPDWHKLDLLAGKANLFLKNTYKGDTYINPNSTEDTLSISLGVDPEVIVERTQVRDLYAKKFFGKNVRERLTYDIKIKNNKSNEIELVVLDQIPVSFHKNVDIELLEKTKGKHDKDKGFIEWQNTLSAGKQKKLRLSYEVTYPKTLYVNL